MGLLVLVPVPRVNAPEEETINPKKKNKYFRKIQSSPDLALQVVFVDVKEQLLLGDLAVTPRLLGVRVHRALHLGEMKTGEDERRG